MVSLLDSPEMSKDACIKCHDGGGGGGLYYWRVVGHLGAPISVLTLV